MKRLEPQCDLVVPVIISMPRAVCGECARCVSLADGLEKAMDDFAIIRIHEVSNFSTEDERASLTIIEAVKRKRPG